MHYLKEQAYFEPLFNNWYAWSYLVPPVQSARHTVNTHRRIMKSFVNNYLLHILACKESGMAGSDYLDCSKEQLNDIKSLIDFTDTHGENLIALSQAVKELDELLRNHTNGESIEYLYENIPNPLKGYVELFFDLEHNLSYRLLESLLYKSDYYRQDLQTVSFGLVSQAHERPFVFSTPRLPDDNHIHLKLSFTAPELKRILQAREIPLTDHEFEAFENTIESSGGLPFSALFTTAHPKGQCPPVKQGGRIQYTGHAGFLLESKDVTILVDPVIASSHHKNVDGVFSFSKLPKKIDYICLTHSHQDHCNLETLIQLRYKTNTILVPKNNGGALQDPSLKLMLQKLDFNVLEMEDMEEVAIPNGKIMSIPFLGEHGDLNIRSKTAWFIDLEGKKILLGADSSNIDPNMYKHIQRDIGDVDVLAIGMECVGAPYTWMYGALHTKKISKSIKESRRLNGCDAELGYGLVEIFRPKQVFIYALGMEPWFKYFMGLEYDDDSTQMFESAKMIENCQAADISCERLFGNKIIEYY